MLSLEPPLVCIVIWFAVREDAPLRSPCTDVTQLYNIIPWREKNGFLGESNVLPKNAHTGDPKFILYNTTVSSAVGRKLQMMFCFIDIIFIS